MVKTTEGLMWKSLKLGNETIRYTPIAVINEELQNCTEKGEILEKKQLQKAEYRFYTAKGEEYKGEVYKLKDGEAVSKTQITKEIANEDIQKTDTKTAYDLVYEHEYLISASDSFTDKLKDGNMALKFQFNSGFGYKPSVAILFYDGIVNSLVMRVGRALRSKIVFDIVNYQTIKAQAKKQLAELQSNSKVKTIKGVDI